MNGSTRSLAAASFAVAVLAVIGGLASTVSSPGVTAAPNPNVRFLSAWTRWFGNVTVSTAPGGAKVTYTATGSQRVGIKAFVQNVAAGDQLSVSLPFTLGVNGTPPRAPAAVLQAFNSSWGLISSTSLACSASACFPNGGPWTLPSGTANVLVGLSAAPSPGGLMNWSASAIRPVVTTTTAAPTTTASPTTTTAPTALPVATDYYDVALPGVRVEGGRDGASLRVIPQTGSTTPGDFVLRCDSSGGLIAPLRVWGDGRFGGVCIATSTGPQTSTITDTTGRYTPLSLSWWGTLPFAGPGVPEGTRSDLDVATRLDLVGKISSVTIDPIAQSGVGTSVPLASGCIVAVCTVGPVPAWVRPLGAGDPNRYKITFGYITADGFNARGTFTLNVLPASAPTTTTPATTTTSVAAATGCRARVATRWDSGGGPFGSDVTVTNLGASVTNWTITWQFSNAATITDGWGASLTQAGTTVTARSSAYSGALATNAAVTIGFNATGPNGPLIGLRLNGQSCL